MNRYPSIGRVGALAIALGVGGVVVPTAATPSETGATTTTRPAVTHYVAHSGASVTLAAEPVAAPPKTAVFTAHATEPARYTGSTARAERPRVSFTGHRDTAAVADNATDSPLLILSAASAARAEPAAPAGPAPRPPAAAAPTAPMDNHMTRRFHASRRSVESPTTNL